MNYLMSWIILLIAVNVCYSINSIVYIPRAGPCRSTREYICYYNADDKIIFLRTQGGSGPVVPSGMNCGTVDASSAQVGVGWVREYTPLDNWNPCAWPFNNLLCHVDGREKVEFLRFKEEHKNVEEVRDGGIKIENSHLRDIVEKKDHYNDKNVEVNGEGIRVGDSHEDGVVGEKEHREDKSTGRICDGGTCVEGIQEGAIVGEVHGMPKVCIVRTVDGCFNSFAEAYGFVEGE